MERKTQKIKQSRQLSTFFFLDNSLFYFGCEHLLCLTSFSHIHMYIAFLEKNNFMKVVPFPEHRIFHQLYSVLSKPV